MFGLKNLLVGTEGLGPKRLRNYLTGSFLMVSSLIGTTDKQRLDDLFDFNEFFGWNVYDEMGD